MRFDSFYSSSMGNLYCVTAANGKRLLIECGCTWKKLQKALGSDLSNIVGALCSHEHKDHSKCVGDVLTAGIDVYASKGTFDAIEESLHLHRKAFIIEGLKGTNITDTFRVFPFSVNHDAAEPLGFIVQEIAWNEYLLFVTDTSHINQRFGIAFNIIAICCNYDGDVLAKREASGDINTEFAKRLLDSHMEKETTKAYLRDHCCLVRCTEIWLLHMSESNIDMEAVRAEFENEFIVKTHIAGRR